MRHASAASSAGPGGFICCLLGDEQYALHAADVRIVARAEQMRLESTTAAGRVGTLTHGDRELPVYSLSALFGRTPDRSGLDRHVIVTRGARGQACGLLVDRMLRAPVEQPGRLIPLPASVGPVAKDWFDGLLTFGDDLACLVLSPASLDPRHASTQTRADEERGKTAAHRAVAHQSAAEIVTTFTSDALPGIGVRRFAVGAHRVAAVTQALPSIPIPGAVAWVDQLGRWRDQAVPILSFSPKTTGEYATRGSRHLVVRTGGRYSGGFVAFRVNADIELHRATTANADPAARQPIDAKFVVGIYMVGREPVALLDIDRLTAGVSAAPAHTLLQPAAREPLPLVV